MPEQIGNKVTFATLVASMVVLRILISVSVKDAASDPLMTSTTLEHESVESLNHQGTDPVTSEMTDGSGLDMCSESMLPNVKNCHLDSEYLGNCSCSLADDQWNVIEERNLFASDTKALKSPQNKLFERCKDLQSVNGYKACLHAVESYNCKTKEGPHNKTIYELPLSFLNQKTKDEFEQSRIKLACPPKAIKKDNVFGVDAVFLKNNGWSVVYLIVMLLDGMINFIGPMLDIWIGGVASIVLGIEIIPRLFESAFPWFSIPVLMYVTAYSLMVPSLILKCTSSREWLSDVAVGATFTCSTIGIVFSVIVNTLPPEYVFVCIGVLIILAIICIVHKVILDAAIQRWMGELTQ